MTAKVRVFGRIGRGWVERRAETDAERALAREQQRRADALADFNDFLERQRIRVAAGLKQQTERIHRARWGDCEGDESHLVISRTGTTVASQPIDPRYQEDR